MGPTAVWVGLVLLVASAASSTAVRLASADAKALLDFKKAITSDPQKVLKFWSPSSDCSLWTGVACDGKGRVTSLVLFQNGLVGKLSPSIGSLSQLENLALVEMSLSGELPSTLGNLATLKVLDLSFNKFQGTIPSALTKLKQLYILHVGGNQLTGGVPSALEALKELQVLILAGNRLTGGIPASLGTLGSLQTLALADNKLSGSIPSSFGSLAKLEQLYLANNRLTGSIPATFNKLKKIQVMFLSNNSLAGRVVLPSSPDLSVFDVEGTFVSGPLPLSTSQKARCKRGLKLLLDNTCLRLSKSALGDCCPYCKFATDSKCRAFCNALQLGGACAGHGACLPAPKTKSYTCACSKGYKPAKSSPATCVAGR